MIQRNEFVCCKCQDISGRRLLPHIILCCSAVHTTESANTRNRFIPQAKDIPVGEPARNATIPSDDFRKIPISGKDWEKTCNVFHLLPSHIIDMMRCKKSSIKSEYRKHPDHPERNLHMVTSMSNTTWQEPFGFASTTVNSDLAFAIVFGCSDNHVTCVRNLLRNAEPKMVHPLLMLSICAQLHLFRLEGLVKERVGDREGVEAVLLNGDMDRLRLEDLKKRWYESALAQKEVTMTHRQLLEATSVGSAESAGIRRDEGSSSIKNVGTKEIEGNSDVTRILQRRLADILARFESLTVECRIGVDRISFAVGIVCMLNKNHVRC
jgi:hypothetical protein